jgi:hypothetical protein
MSRFISVRANQLIPGASSAAWVALDTHYPSSSASTPLNRGVALSTDTQEANATVAALNALDPDFSTF